ncbi:MAG TPA: glycosyltransferase [Nevskiaceae bacterium]|nr:glycosyltransferase [Nevskiaceae bacterium]
MKNLSNKPKLPFVSVVIPTYNRGKPLCDTLNSLFVQDYKNYEIIVVDQSTKKFLEKEKFLKENRKKLCYFFLRPPSTPKAKNFGIQQAKGGIILFCDDDILAKKDLISKHVVNFSDSLVGGVCGRVVTVGQKVKPKFKGVGKIAPWGSVAGGFSSKIRQEIDNVIGCNVSWRKEILEKINGFDEDFIGNALREESDLALRIRKQGWKIVFDPKAELTHVRAPTGGCRKNEGRIKWYHDFFHNETYFFLKHIRHYWFLVFWLIRWQYFIRCMFGFGREVSLKSLKTPWLGIHHGFQTYRRWQNEHRR